MDIPRVTTGRLVDRNGDSAEDANGFLLPPWRTFSSVYNMISRTYSHRWDEALRDSRENALAMPRDCFLMGCLQERMLQCSELDFHLEPENPKDQNQVTVAKQLDKIIRRTHRWIQFKHQLCWATWYGRYANQINWQPTTIDGKRRLACKGHTPINGDKIQFGWDGTPRVQVSYQWLYDNAQPGSRLHEQGLIDNYPKDWEKKFPERAALLSHDYTRPVISGELAPMLVLRDPAWRERFVIHKHLCIDADYFDGEGAGGIHGVGLRSQVYWFFDLRDEMVGWAVNHLKKVGVGGILCFFYPEGNAKAQEAAEAAAQSSGERYSIALPVPPDGNRDSAKPELLSFSEAGVQSLMQVVETYFERHIERIIIGQSMSAGGGAAGGLEGSGRAAFAEDTKFRILKFDATNLDDTMTEDYVAVAQKWNFPGAGFRIFYKSNVPDPGADEKIQGIVALAGIGVSFKEDESRGLVGMAKPEDDDKIVSAIELARQQQQLQLEGAQQQQALQLQGQQQQAAMGMQPGAQPAPQQPEQPEQPPEPDHGIPVDGPMFGEGHPANALAAQDDEEPATYDAEHAPKGGVTLAGHEFTGGQFIPAAVMARATPQERMELHQQHRDNAEVDVEHQREQQAELPEPRPSDQPQDPEVPVAAAPESVIPPERMKDLGAFAMTKIANTPHAPAIHQAIQRMAALPRGEFARAAGKAYQRSKLSDEITQDTYDAIAARTIEKFRWQRENLLQGRPQVAPVNKALDKGAKVTGKVIGAVAKPAVRHIAAGHLADLGWGPPRDKYGLPIPRKLMTQQEMLIAQTGRAAATQAANLAAKGIEKGVAQVPALVRWLKGGVPPHTWQASEGPALYTEDELVDALTDQIMGGPNG